jgi:deazaflavin-dependent oxidoreductase (nitroreductase family)
MAATLKSRIPSFVPLLTPLAIRLLKLGMPMGPNALLTVRGRTSGVTRTTPVAMVELGGKRRIIGTFGEVNWVRNLRAAGEGNITVGRRKHAVRAVELTREEATEFLAQELVPYLRRSAVRLALIGALGAREVMNDPVGFAATHPVFELRPVA